MAQFIAYREGTITGAERSVTTLEWTRDIAFAVDSLLTGGAAGIVVGVGLGAAGTAAQQAMEVHLDMRREIDWRGIGIDAALGFLIGLLGGKVFEKLFKYPIVVALARKIGRPVVVRLIQSLVAGSAQAAVQTTLRVIIDNLSGTKNAMNGEQLLRALVAQLTSPRSLFMNIVMGELGHQAAVAGVTVVDQSHGGGGGGGGQRETAPPIQETTPPIQESVPPVQETTPPIQESVPPVQETAPPARELVSEPATPSAEREPTTSAAAPEPEPAPTQVSEPEQTSPSVPEPTTVGEAERAPESPAPVANTSAAAAPLELPTGVATGKWRREALRLIGELPPAQRNLIMETMRRLPPQQAGQHLTAIGKMGSASTLLRVLEVGQQRVSGEAPRAGGEFGSPEQMQQHGEEVAPQIVDEPDGRTRVPEDSTEGPTETSEPLEGLSTIERRPPARISPEQRGADRSSLRQGMTPPEWATDGRSWEAHHVIPVELQFHEVLEVLRNKGGWDHNAPANGIALPTRPNTPGAEGLPVHQITTDVIAAARAERVAQGGPEVPMPDAQTMRDLQGHPVTNESVKQQLDQIGAQRLADGTRLIDNPQLLRQAIEALQQKLILDMHGGRQVAQP
jgi:hypothetical protein